jgi:hypothetical protein
MIDPKYVSLYNIAHDWWGVAAFLLAAYKGLNYLKSFKETVDQALAAVQDVKTDMADGRHSIRAELKQQTEAVVSELRDMRQLLFLSVHPATAPRPVRAKRRKNVVDTSAEV